jgi:hypothetical protein
MAEFYTVLAVWVIGMFGIIGICIGYLAKLIKYDSKSYDEAFIWMRKIED